MKKVTTCFLIKGRNLGNFINLLKNRGILLLNVKILSQNELTFCVNECDAEKIFAIGNELCYNIRVIREWGLLYPVLFLKRNLGILIGSLIFIIMVLFSNNYIFEISYSGSGNAYKNQVKNYLDGQGVKQFTKFSSIDLSKLSKDILSTNENLSFVSCQKRGNVLKIELVASDKAGDSLTGKEKSLVADADGVIEDIKVYRGTAKKF